MFEIDSQGAVSLGYDAAGNLFAGGFAVADGAGQQIYSGVFGSEWNPIAAETIDGVNTVLWQHESGALHSWQTDANWQWTGSEGWWTPGSAEFDAAEANFGVDANGDGVAAILWNFGEYIDAVYTGPEDMDGVIPRVYCCTLLPPTMTEMTDYPMNVFRTQDAGVEIGSTELAIAYGPSNETIPAIEMGNSGGEWSALAAEPTDGVARRMGATYSSGR